MNIHLRKTTTASYSVLDIQKHNNNIHPDLIWMFMIFIYSCMYVIQKIMNYFKQEDICSLSKDLAMRPCCKWDGNSHQWGRRRRHKVWKIHSARYAFLVLCLKCMIAEYPLVDVNIATAKLNSFSYFCSLAPESVDFHVLVLSFILILFFPSMKISIITTLSGEEGGLNNFSKSLEAIVIRQHLIIKKNSIFKIALLSFELISFLLCAWLTVMVRNKGKVVALWHPFKWF